MSFVLTQRALRITGISPTDKLVLVCIADHARCDTGLAWPSQARVAEITGYSLRTVTRSVLSLREAGYLVDVTPEGVRHNTYRVTVGSPVVAGGDGCMCAACTRSQPRKRATTPADVCTSDTQPAHVATHSRPASDTVSQNPCHGDALIDKRTHKRTDNREAAPADAGPPRRTRIPPSWQPSPAGHVYATTHHIDPTTEAQAFVDYHTAKGSLMVDWAAAWRTWVRRAVTYGRVKPTPDDTLGQWARLRDYSKPLEETG